LTTPHPSQNPWKLAEIIQNFREHCQTKPLEWLNLSGKCARLLRMFEDRRHAVRPWFRRNTDETVGTAYFRKGEPRVAPGEAKFVDLCLSRSTVVGTPAVFRAGVYAESISFGRSAGCTDR